MTQDEMVNSLIASSKMGREMGIGEERDRIIKLLEPLAKHYESCYYNKELACTFEDCHAYDYEQAIRLIKGEQE